MRGHAGQLRLGQLVVVDGRAEDLALPGVVEGGVVGGLHQADGPGRGLEPAVLESLHLQVEAVAQPALAADRFSSGTSQSSKETS